jgi:hypothetical protein
LSLRREFNEVVTVKAEGKLSLFYSEKIFAAPSVFALEATIIKKIFDRFIRFYTNDHFSGLMQGKNPEALVECVMVDKLLGLGFVKPNISV